MHLNDARREGQAQVVDLKAVVIGIRRSRLRSEPEHLCRLCGQRTSRFFFRGVVTADRAHTLCFECYRAVVNHARAHRLTVGTDLWPLASPLPVPASHRGDPARVYQDLAQRRQRAQMAARHALDGLAGVRTETVTVPLQMVS